MLLSCFLDRVNQVSFCPRAKMFKAVVSARPGLFSCSHFIFSPYCGQILWTFVQQLHHVAVNSVAVSFSSIPSFTRLTVPTWNRVAVSLQQHLSASHAYFFGEIKPSCEAPPVNSERKIGKNGQSAFVLKRFLVSPFMAQWWNGRNDWLGLICRHSKWLHLLLVLHSRVTPDIVHIHLCRCTSLIFGKKNLVKAFLKATDEDGEHINNVSVCKKAELLAVIRVSALCQKKSRDILSYDMRTEFFSPLAPPIGEGDDKQHFQPFQKCLYSPWQLAELGGSSD